MVGRAANLDDAPKFMARDSGHILVETWAKVRIDLGGAVFRPEDDMDEQVRIRVSHEQPPFATCGGSRVRAVTLPRAHARYVFSVAREFMDPNIC